MKTRSLLAVSSLLIFCELQAGDARDERIRAVQESLLPAFVVKGRSLQFMRMDDRMRHHGVPGVSIAVINGHAPAWARGYGMANSRTGEPVTAITLFQAASVSKPVVAMLALSLVDAGLLELDQDVNVALRTWRRPDSEYSRDSKVTLRTLLAHSAGLNASGFLGYEVGTKLPTLTQILEGETPANSVPIRVRAEPGARWHYSGGGYLVVQQLLEDLTGEPFSRLVKTVLFERLDMERSTYAQPLSERQESAAAIGHSDDGEPITGGWRVYPELAAAGLWTTPSDLSRLVVALQRAVSGSDVSTLSRDMATSMVMPQQADWGLGFNVGTTGQARWVTHTGHNEGFTCYLFAYTGLGQGAVVMANADQADELIMEILRGIAHVYGWPDFQPDEISVQAVDPATYDRYLGEYALLNFDGSNIIVSREGDQLLGRFFGEWLEMLPESETDYVIPGRDMAVHFGENADAGAWEISLTLPEVPFLVVKARRVE